MRPRVSVLMPVYNGEKYLRAAVESILGQTFTDFEFLIIDDGSVDRSADIVESYDDQRIHFIRNSSNLGLTATLNKGIEMAAGEYIARMDCDDISLPQRLAKQVAFMDSNREVAVSGTWATDIDGQGRVLSNTRKFGGEQLEYQFWRPSPLYHSSAIIRVSHLGDLRYDAKARHAEDYDLWLRLKKRHKLDNLQECLLLYRVHPKSISTVNSDRQLRSAHGVFCRHIGLLVPFEEFLELIEVTRNMNPVRRAVLRRRLAGAIHKPYKGFVKADISYAKEWLRPRLSLSVMKWQITKIAYYLRRHVKPQAAKDALERKDTRRLS